MKKICAIAAVALLSLTGVLLTACEVGKGRELTAVAITAQPTKTTYTVGEEFDPAGAEITATYADESTSEAIAVTKEMCAPVDMATPGSKDVTVSYKEGKVTKSAVIPITVGRAEFANPRLKIVDANNNMFTLYFSMTEDVAFDDWNVAGEMSADKWAEIVQSYVDVVTGDEAASAAAARKIGTDVFVAVYGKNAEGQKILLTKTADGNPVLKHKGWNGWLNTSATEHWYPNGSDNTASYVGATLPKDTEFRTSVSGLDSYANWKEIRATGKLYADLTVVQNGIAHTTTVSADFR